MKPRIVEIKLCQPEAVALGKLARAERRALAEQAAASIRADLARRGLLAEQFPAVLPRPANGEIYAVEATTTPEADSVPGD